MTPFNYRALNLQGGEQSGLIEAKDKDAAVALLHKRGLMVLHIEASRLGWLRQVLRCNTMSGANLLSFTQQLATLLGAGQSLERSLTILFKQRGDLKIRSFIERIREQVKTGKPLSAALEGEDHLQFSSLYISMVRAGEAGGALEQTLRQLSEYLERSQSLRGEVTNALIYPTFLVVGVLGALALLLTYVVPQFVPIFQDLSVPIPFITQAILWFSEFLNSYGLAVLFSIISLTWIYAIRLRDPQHRLNLDRCLLKNRIIGPQLQRIEVARLTRTLGTLLGNDVSLLQALLIARQVCNNRALRYQVEQAIESIKGGGTLTSAFGKTPLLPDLALQMIEVGEHASELDSMLLKVAEVFDVEAKRGIDRMLAALVPTLTLVMAALVAMIMLAIMLPLMSLTSNI